MDRLRQHLSRRRRSSSSSATPLQSPRFPSTDRRQDERDVSPRRLYVTSDTHDFDPSIIARFQGEGFEVEYLPFPGGNEDIERDRKDLLNLLHEREDNLEPGERYAVVAYHRPAFLLLASHHQSTTATNPLPRMCALVTYYPREPLDETCKEETNSPACLLPPSTTSTSTSSCYASLSLLPIQIHLAGHQNPSFWDDYSAHPSRKRHRCHLFFYPESEPGFAEHPSHTYDRLSSRVAWSRALDCLKRGFGWPGGSWKTPDVETIWEEYWRNLLFDARRHPDAEGYAANVMKMMIGSGDPSSLDRQIDETPLVNCVPTMVGGMFTPSHFTFLIWIYRCLFLLTVDRKRRAVDFSPLRGKVLPYRPPITAHPLAFAHRGAGPHRRRDPAGVPAYRGDTLVAAAGTAHGPRREDCACDDGQFPRGQALPAEYLLGSGECAGADWVVGSGARAGEFPRDGQDEGGEAGCGNVAGCWSGRGGEGSEWVESSAVVLIV